MQDEQEEEEEQLYQYRLMDGPWQQMVLIIGENWRSAYRKMGRWREEGPTSAHGSMCLLHGRIIKKNCWIKEISLLYISF